MTTESGRKIRKGEGKGGKDRDQTEVDWVKEWKAGETTRRPFVRILFPLFE